MNSDDIERDLIPYLDRIQAPRQIADRAATVEPLDRIGLITRAEYAVVWWSLTSRGVARTRAKIKGDELPQLILRVYLTHSDGASKTLDIELDRWSGSHRISLPAKASQVSAAVGCRSSAYFIHMAEAATIQLPRGVHQKGPLRESELDWSKGGRRRRDISLESIKKGASLCQYVYDARSKSVVAGWLGDGCV